MQTNPVDDRPPEAFAVVTGGGTAGHVLPALAVADAIVAEGFDRRQVLYIGCQRGIETELVPPTGYPYSFLDVVGFQRSLTKKNIAFVPKLVGATRAALQLLRRARPKVVVSVGGYASMPAVLAARRIGIPIVTVSFDHRPGRASVLTAKISAAAAVAFPDSPLPRASVTGAPVRAEILAVDRGADREAARAEFQIPPDRFMIAVAGGSQGSRALNEATWAYLDQHADDRTLAIRHAVGARFLDAAPPAQSGVDGAIYQPVAFEPMMASVYAAADLLIGRGGASTVHEVAVAGVPAVLVPWPDAAEDHQTGNVRWLSDRDASVLLPEDQIGRLGVVIDELRADSGRRDRLSANASELGSVHRGGAIAKLVLEVAGVSVPPVGASSEQPDRRR